MNSNELIINGKDAWTNYRVKMGSGFLDALEADASRRSNPMYLKALALEEYFKCLFALRT